MVAVMGRRALSRATLDRRLLLRRWDPTVPEPLVDLAGSQARSTRNRCLGLWSRLVGYRSEPTDELLRSGEIVRMALSRLRPAAGGRAAAARPAEERAAAVGQLARR
ncbi:hypothetical protein ACFVH6_42990 [Spirillospora sp. NPDC127200]